MAPPPFKVHGRLVGGKSKSIENIGCLAGWNKPAKRLLFVVVELERDDEEGVCLSLRLLLRFLSLISPSPPPPLLPSSIILHLSTTYTTHVARSYVPQLELAMRNLTDCAALHGTMKR